MFTAQHIISMGYGRTAGYPISHAIDGGSQVAQMVLYMLLLNPGRPKRTLKPRGTDHPAEPAT
jgi:hypothetical protein